MPVQDDQRELEMVRLFNLTVPDDRSRADIDAHLVIDGRRVNFELKSTTGKSVSTVRDFGPEHIRKWRDDLHWIFAFYDKSGTRLQYCIYASPADMEPWIAQKERYIKPDLELAEHLPPKTTEQMVVDLLGQKDVYTLAEAKWILKNQWKASQYKEAQDVEGGYSLARMTEILRQRGRYVILRGSTLNNPHIEGGFFARFEKIETEHAARLRELVRDYLNTAPTDDATA